MEDRLKFRAWIKELGIMVDVLSLNTVGGITAKIDGKYIYADYSDYILMQSTGLKDKNGVLVFENDIITITGYSYHEPEFVYSGVIKSDCFGFKVESLEDAEFERLYDLTGEFYTEYVILGNIHQNPEMLEVE